MPTRGKNNINIWLPVIISILIGHLRNIFISKQPRSSSVFGCSVNCPDWNVTIIYRFFPKMFEMTTEKVFHGDDKYVLRLLNVIIHKHQFKRKGKYCKFHFDKEAYTTPKNVRIFMFFLYLVNILLHFYFRVQVPLKYPCEILFWISREIFKTIITYTTILF